MLDVPLAHWQAAIAARVRGMFERGFVDEVRGIVERYGGDIRALRSVGYRQVVTGLQAGAPEARSRRKSCARRACTDGASAPGSAASRAWTCARADEALGSAAIERIAAHLAAQLARANLRFGRALR